MTLRCVKRNCSCGLASIVAVVLLASPASAQGQGARDPKASRRVVWTIVGTGAGFGVGLYLGLNRFDDAINSERKIWTTALIGAAAGGGIAWLIARNGDTHRPAITRRAVGRIEVQREGTTFRFGQLVVPVGGEK